MSAAVLRIVNSLEQRIQKVYSKELLFNFTKGMLYSAIFFLSLAFFIVIFESIFHFGITTRKIFYWGFISTFVTTFIYITVNYIFQKLGVIKPLDVIPYSKKVGENFPEVKDRLSNSLFLVENSQGTNFSNELISANIEEVYSSSERIDFTNYVSFKSLKKPFIIFLSAVFIWALSLVVFPQTMLGSMNRLVNYNYNFLLNDLGIAFIVTPGNVEVSKGENVNIKVLISSTKPTDINEITLVKKEITKDGSEILSDKKDVKISADKSFNAVLENVNNDIIYYVEYEGVQSDEFRIKTNDNPLVKNFKITVTPPGFTSLPPKYLADNEGEIFCMQGSSIYFDLKSNKPLSEAGIILEGKLIKFNVTDAGASGTITANTDGSYKFYLKDKNGAINKNVVTYNIKVIPDEPPSITIIEPNESNFVLTGQRDILLRSRISDDYGFSSLKLAYKKFNGGNIASSSANYNFINIPIQNLTARSLEIPYIWNLPGISSGQTIEYFLEVTDNTGHSVKSDTRTITYKSLSDALKNTEALNKELKTDVNNSLQNLNDVQKELQELKKDAQRNEDLGLNDPKQKQELENKLNDLQKNLNSTQQKLEQSVNEMKQRNELSEKTLEQYMELQKMYNKINTPELQEMLKKLQEAMKKNNSDEMKDALKNFKFDEEAFKKYLEKVMELMKKIENMQKFGELTQKLDEITKKQDELKNETKSSDKNDQNKLNELSQKQKDIKEQTKEFQEELKKLIEELKKQKEMSAEDLEKIRKKMEQKQIENKMNKSSEDMKKGDKNSSEDEQEEISQDLNEMNEEMMDAMENMMDSQSQQKKMMEKMGNIKKDLEELSKRQQELKDKTEDLEKNQKQEFDKNKKEQGNLQSDLAKTIDDVMNLSKSGVQIKPEMGKELGNAFNKMDKAGKELGEQDKDGATSDQGDAKTSLDKAGEMMGEMMKKMGQQGKDGKDGKGKGNSGRMGELMQQLAQMIQQQQGVNGQMGKMGKDGKKGKDGKDGKGDESGEGELSEQQKGDMQRLQMEQQQLSKSLEELNEELKKEQERSGEKILGDLNQVQKEMQEVIKDMQNNNVTDKTIEKQNRILSRMLDAQLSQREKDFEPKRESKPGNNMVRQSPPEIILSGPNSFNALKEDILKLQKEGYTDDYEILIMKYLQKVNSQPK
jgi:hypothetical protein